MEHKIKDNSLMELQSQLDNLKEENLMLFSKLHKTQEELLRYYLIASKVDNALISNNPSIAIKSMQGTSYPLSFKYFLEALREFSKANSENSFSSKLAHLLLYTPKYKIPYRLFRLIQEHKNHKVPSLLGRKNFEKVISTFANEKQSGVEKLLDSVSISFTVRANAYTHLAKDLQKKDIYTCVHYAKLAYLTDPQPYRLKWLAYRLEDSGDIDRASAAAFLLSEHTKMNEYETKRIKNLQPL